jgi:hypothetical protein
MLPGVFREVVVLADYRQEFLGMSTEGPAQVIRCLVEGCSINLTNSTVRITCEEIWQFVGCKQKNVTMARIERDGVCRDVWTWTAIDADTKLIPCWMNRSV